MTFIKYTQTATRLKRLNVELDYFIEPELDDDMQPTGDFIESESGQINAIYEGSDGKDIVIRKSIGDATDSNDKTEITKLLKKIVKEAEKAI